VNANQHQRFVQPFDKRQDVDILGRFPGDTNPLNACVESDPRPEPYVDANEGAAFLRIHPKTLQRLARIGMVPAYSLSDGIRRHWRFLLSELDTWMRSRVNSNAHPVRSVSPGRRK
jgi:hypothetical protein